MKRAFTLGSLAALVPQKMNAAPAFMLLDAGLCFAALASGISLTSAQIGSFVVSSLLACWIIVRPQVMAGPSARVLLSTLLAVILLAFFMRSGVLELMGQGLGLPQYAAVLSAVLVSGFITQTGYGLCVQPRTQPYLDVGVLRALVFAVAGYAFILRLVYSAQIELLPEETYYWNYARHLDIGYLDHPPLVAWLIHGGTLLFGDTEFGVRFPALACGVVTSVFVYRLTRNVFGEPSALLAVMFAQALPFFFLSGMLMTPDAPLTAAWAASLYYLERALVAGRSGAWLGVGICVGLGLLSKYTIGLLVLGAFLFMVVDPFARRWFSRWQPYSAVLVAGILFGPVVFWNSQHEWASFAFQTSRRLAERPRFSLHKLLGAALVLLTPTGLVAVWAAFKQGSPPTGSADEGTAATARAWRFLSLCLLAPLVVFLCFSLRHEVKLDWTGAPWLAALPVIAHAITDPRGGTASRALRWVRISWAPTLIIMLIVYGAGFYYLASGIPGVNAANPHMELIPLGWRDLGRQIDVIAADARAKYGVDTLVVGMDRYAIASELAFYSHDQTVSVARTSSAHLFDDMGLMYEQWFPVDHQTGRTLVLVAWNADALSAVRLTKHVASQEPIGEGAVMRNGVLLRRYYYRVVHGYH
jgi:dolichol-phosphate mannosyltransferase